MAYPMQQQGQEYILWLDNSASYAATLETYPNLANDELPACARCARPENELNARLAFQRFCPNIFTINGVKYAQHHPQKSTCIWEVDYTLDDGGDLPTPGPTLDALCTCLIRYRPLDTIIINKSCAPPKIITIHYSVMCSCDPVRTS
jgi:hypothetical protein